MERLIFILVGLVFLSGAMSTKTYGQDVKEIENAIKVGDFTEGVFILGAKKTENNNVITRNADIYQLQVNTQKLLSGALVSLPFPGAENLYLLQSGAGNSSSGREVREYQLIHYENNTLHIEEMLRAQMSINGNQLSGHFQWRNHSYQITPVRGGAHQLTIIALDDFPFQQDGEPSEHAEDDLSAHSTNQSTLAAGDSLPGDALTSAAVIDVLVVYERNATAENADPFALSAMAIAQANEVFTNSGVAAELRLVGNANVNFVRTSSVADLYSLTDKNDGVLEEVHGYRDALGADLVVLMVGGGYDDCGRAWIRSSEEEGFAIVNDDCAVGNYTFVHELGHNFGAHHNPEVDNNLFYTDGHGLFNQNSRWRTVMSYECLSTTCARIPYFSNPQLTFQNEQIGSVSLHNNARVLNARAANLAAFRQPPAACLDFTATLNDHVSAGRVTRRISFFGARYYVVGSNEYLGRDASQTVTLLAVGAGFAVGDCAAVNPPQVNDVQWTLANDSVVITGRVVSDVLPVAAITATDALQPDNPTLCKLVSSSEFRCELHDLLPGQYQVTLTALDTAGNHNPDLMPLEFVVASGLPPSVDSAAISVDGAQVRVSGQVSDLDGDVAEVTLHISDLNGNQNDSPDSRSCNLLANNSYECVGYGLESGQYQASVVAVDAKGNQSAAYGPLAFAIELGNAPAIARLEIETVDDYVVLTGDVYDEDGDIQAVEAELWGPTLRTQTCALFGAGVLRSFRCEFLNLSPGVYLFGLMVIDAADNRGFYEGDNLISLGNANTPPQLTLNDVVASGLTVDLFGTVSDPDNDIILLEGRVASGSGSGETFLCFYTANFQCQWLAPSTGNYTLEVYVEDALGFSAQVTANVTVDSLCQVYNATLGEHLAAGRAELIYRYFANRYYAIGSGDYLGRNASDTADLAETQLGYFQLGGCP